MTARTADLLANLASAGYPVADVWELVNTRQSCPEALPVLLAWLKDVDSQTISRQTADVEGVVRALAVREARGVAAPQLVHLFRLAYNAIGTRNRWISLGWAIGNTLAVVANDAVADGMLELATDRRYGKTREMVVLGLGRLNRERVEQTLIDLVLDEEVAGHAIAAVRSLGSRRAAPVFAAMLDHPKPWIRKEAKQALAKLDRGAKKDH